MWWARVYFNVRKKFKKEKKFSQHDVENKQLKKENEQLRKENEQLRKNNIDAKIKELIEKPIEIKSPEEDKNTKDNYLIWFEKILAIIDSNKFNYKNKIGEFKYIDIKDLVNNIRNNTISEIPAKTSLNILNEIKKRRNNKKEKVHP